MPYSRNDELPKSVRDAIPSQKALTMFRRVVNSQMGAKKPESVAFASAWSALKNAGYKKQGGVWVKKARGAMPMYGYRPVMNAESLIEWAKSQGLTKSLAADDMHVTVVYSRDGYIVNEYAEPSHTSFYGNLVVRGGKRSVSPLGDKGAVVLKIESIDLTQEWLEHRRMGASYDYESYIPHVTITYDSGVIDPSKIEPYMGDIVLGPLRLEALKTDYKPDMVEIKKRMINDDAFTEPNEAMVRSYDLGFDGKIHVHEVGGQAVYMPAASHEEYLRGAQDRAILSPTNQEDSGDEYEGMDPVRVEIEVKISKRSDEQRIVWGWASVSTVGGEPVYDAHGDYWPADEMMKTANEFMKDVRVLKAMHSGEQIGRIIHSFPMTSEIAKAFDIETDKEGWIIGTYVEDDKKWEDAKNGKLPAFSIGGWGKRYAA